MSLKKWILASTVFLMLLGTVFLFIQPNSLVQIPLPNPNGYDDLVKAGEMFVGDLPECVWSNLNDECLAETQAYLTTNREALERARLGLTRESRVPTEFTQAYIGKHLPDLAKFKRLAQTLAAEGKVAEKENRMDDAIQSYLDAARLNEKMRGGLMIDALVGIATETIGIGPLQKLSDSMTSEQRRAVIKSLARLYANRDSFEDTLNNEDAYFRNSSGVRDQIARLLMFRSMRRAEQKFETKIKFRRARLGLFLIDLAAKNFESDKGRPPKTLQELVPDYLSFLPKDDFSGINFVYRPITNGYQLYGVGSDKKDDGGTPLVQEGTDSAGDMVPNTR